MNSGRRDFFKTVGTVAAAAAAASPVLKPAESVAAASTGRSVSASRFALALEGTPAGFLRSFEGGDIVGVVGEEQVTETGVVPKYIAGIRIEDILISGGVEMPSVFFQWIQQFLNRNPQLHSGAIISVDARNRAISQLSFSNTRISEVTFPELDAKSKELALIDVRLEPEFTRQEVPSAGPLPPPSGSKAKVWLSSNFRVRIGGINEAATARVSKIDAITIKQKTAPESQALDRSAINVEPLDVGSIVLTVAEQFAQPFFDWHNDFVVKGDGGEETFLTIEYLSPNLRETFLTLTFLGVGIVRASREKLDTQDSGLRRVQVELYAEQVSLTLGAPPTA